MRPYNLPRPPVGVAGRKALMFTLKLNTDNAAFEGEDKPLEVARILRAVASRLEQWGSKNSPCLDCNGHIVGTWKLT